MDKPTKPFFLKNCLQHTNIFIETNSLGDPRKGKSQKASWLSEAVNAQVTTGQEAGVREPSTQTGRHCSELGGDRKPGDAVKSQSREVQYREAGQLS